MGTWGTGLFSDDTACDIRSNYRDLVGEGLPGSQATDTLVREWADALDDPTEASVFWLSLASTQWQCGRLEQRVKEKALAVIDSGSDLQRWIDSPKLLKKREIVLAKLRVKLLSPQPPQKRIPKRYKNTCEWEVGEVISYRLLSGKLILFRVIGFHSDKGGTFPVCEVLDWVGTEIPSEKVLKYLGVKSKQYGDSQFMIGCLKEKDFPKDRVQRLGIIFTPTQKPRGYSVFLWRYLDRQLEELFGIC